jgi:BRCT domain type II-containing protein
MTTSLLVGWSQCLEGVSFVFTPVMLLALQSQSVYGARVQLSVQLGVIALTGAFV